MSEPQEAASQEDSHDVHEGPIKTPKQLIWTVLASFVVPVVVIIMLVNFVDFSSRAGAGSDGMAPEVVASRIKPVGAVEVRDASDPASIRSGEQVYQGQCVACHGSGAAGAPKFGDEGAWGPRLKQGFDTLLQSALKGKGAMGPQSGGDFSDFEIARAVVYMANHGGGKFEEPKAPAAAAPAASAPN